MDHVHFSAPTSSAIINSPAHLIPGCDGYGHDDGVCEIALDCLNLTSGEPNALNVTVNASDGKPAELAVWQDWNGDLLRTSDPATAAAFADRLRAFAAAIDKGAALLASPVVGPAKPDPAVDYAARFAALDSDVLFGLEQAGDCDDAQRYVESLLIVLAEWRPRVVAMLADAPEWAVPEAAAYRRALDRTREAWTQYSFRWTGGPVLPWPFGLPEPAPKGAAIRRTPVARISRPGRRDLTVRGVAA